MRKLTPAELKEWHERIERAYQAAKQREAPRRWVPALVGKGWVCVT